MADINFAYIFLFQEKYQPSYDYTILTEVSEMSYNRLFTNFIVFSDVPSGYVR